MTAPLLILCGVVMVLGWVFALCRVASREVDLNGDLKRSDCPRCRMHQAEHGKAEFPTCLLCGAETATHCDHGVSLSAETCRACDPFINVFRIDSRRGE